MQPQGPQFNQLPQHLSGDLFAAMPPQGTQFGGQAEFGTPAYGYRSPEDVARTAHLHDANPQQPQIPANGEQFLAALEEETPTEVMNIGPNAETMRIPRETMDGIIGGLATQEAAKPQPGVTYTRDEQTKFRDAEQQARQPQRPQDTSAAQWGKRAPRPRPGVVVRDEEDFSTHSIFDN